MNKADNKQESAVPRNMAGMTESDVREYVTVNRSWGCLTATVCFSALAGIVAGYLVWTACVGGLPTIGKLPESAQTPYSVCPFCGLALDGTNKTCVPENQGLLPRKEINE